MSYSPWYLKINDQWKAVAVDGVKHNSKGVVAQFENCRDRDQALAMTHIDIAIKKDQLYDCEDGEFLLVRFRGAYSY